MSFRFTDKFDRADGPLGDAYDVPCGGVIISDEAVIPIDAAEIISGVSPILPNDVTAQKTQVLYTAEAMNGPDYVVRTTWAHDGNDPSSLPSGVTQPPSFTALARMGKDPLLYDLGTAEDPNCYDQGYGARVTFPLDGTAPTLKIIKFMPAKRLPGQSRPSSTEVDGMVVLASAVLDPDDLNLDPDFDAEAFKTGDVLPYKGFWQDMRLRIRRADNEVILDVYLNDRNLNTSKLTYTDRRDPLWGVVGLPGFEFLSATLADQPAGASPFGLAGMSLLRCGIFSCETFLDVRRPVNVTPGTFYTYREVVNRVILLVERDGDAKYNASTAGQTKFDTYLRFVIEAEADIIRKEGYFEWLRRTGTVYLRGGLGVYELPDDLGLLDSVRPGNWNAPPLSWMARSLFFQRLQGTSSSGGRPTLYTTDETGPNSRQQIRLFPFPGENQISQVAGEDPFLFIDYFARQIYPSEPDVQIPVVPQQHMDVLTYGAAAHALLIDTDDANSQRFAAVYMSKLKDLRRANNRNMSQLTVMRSAADVIVPSANQRPLLRTTQLEALLAF